MSARKSVAIGFGLWALVALAAGSGTDVGARQRAAPATATIDGTVLDAAGAPVPGARVTLSAGQSEAGPVVGRQVTAQDGRFRFANVRAGSYAVSAELAGYKTTMLRLAVTAGDALSVRIQLHAGNPGDVVEQKAGDLARAGTATALAPPPAPVAPPPGQLVASEMLAGQGQGGRGGMAYRDETQRAFVRRPWPPFDPDSEDYAAIAHNPFNLTRYEPLSTFAADVDTASFTNVRRFLNDGQLPPVDAVRVEEFVNYFHYDYPDPTSEHPVSVTTEVGAAPWAPDHRLVLVGVRARPIDQRDVAGRNIVLLIDVSGSMGTPNKLPLAKTALRMFVDTLRDDDRIAIVVYAGASGLVLPSTSGRHRDRIHDAIENLHAGGSTNGAQGLQLAYKVAGDEMIRGGINRVILLTDGDFNVGLTSQSELLHLIEEKKQSGIFLSVLGVGTGNLKDSTMEMLADKGNGHYAYLDSLHEARRVLVREGGATLETVAKDVKFQVEFNPATVAAWKLIGYENRLLAHRDFNDDTKDGGELGAGHTVTVLYEVVPLGVELPEELRPDDGQPVIDDLTYQSDRRPTGNPRDLLTVKIRYKQPDEDVSALLAQPVRDGGDARALPLAAAVAEFGLLLRDEHREPARLAALAARLKALPVGVDDAADRQGLLDLVELAASLRRLR